MSMEREPNYTPSETEFGSTAEAGRKGGTVAAPYPGVATPIRGATAAEVGEAAYLGFSRATWSSIWAGFFIGAMTNLVLTTLGMALGISWINDDRVAEGSFRTAAGVWMLLTSLVSFFAGGCVTARMSGLPGRSTGAMNGFLYGCFAWVLVTALAMTPMMSVLSSYASVFAQMGGMPPMAPGEMPAVNTKMAQSAAWWAFFGLIISLAAATIGGLVGARKAEVDPLGTGATHTA